MNITINFDLDNEEDARKWEEYQRTEKYKRAIKKVIRLLHKYDFEFLIKDHYELMGSIHDDNGKEKAHNERPFTKDELEILKYHHEGFLDKVYELVEEFDEEN